MREFELVTESAFLLAFLLVGGRALYAYAAQVSPHEQARFYGVGILYWCVSFAVALVGECMTLGPEWGWIANAADAVGSWLVFCGSCLLAWPCWARNDERKCALMHPHTCSVRVVLSFSGLITAAIWCVAIWGATVAGYKSSWIDPGTAGRDVQMLGVEWFDGFFAVATALATAAAGGVLVHYFGGRRHPVTLVGYSLLAFAVSDAIQPVAAYVPGGYGPDNAVWWIEWGLAWFGLALFLWGNWRWTREAVS